MSGDLLSYCYRWFPVDTLPKREAVLDQATSDPDVRTTESIAAMEAEKVLKDPALLSFETRMATRTLLASTIPHGPLLDTLDGMLLPPPFAHPFEREDEVVFVTRDAVEAAALAIPPEFRPLVVRMPLNLALQSGVYDACLRVAMRRLCHALDEPFADIEAKEEELAVTILSQSAGDQPEISKKRTMTVGRAMKIGAFTVIGGAALFFTGGLAAPLVAPAFGAMLGATATTAAAVGAAGAAAGGTIATVFAAIVGVATQAAALGVLLTPMLTAGNVTAILGAGGAGLGAWKGKNRTAGVGEVRFRPLSSLEHLPPMPVVAPEDTESASFAAISKHADPAAALESGTQTPDAKEEAERFGKGTLAAVVVPNHVRTTAVVNISKSPKVKDRRRSLCVAISNGLEVAALELKTTELRSGEWVYAPPHRLATGATGVFLSANKSHRPTGTGGGHCFVVQAPGKPYDQVRVWAYASISLAGTTTVSCLVMPQNHIGTDAEAIEALRITEDAHRLSFSHSGIRVEATTRPQPQFMISLTEPEVGTANSGPRTGDADGATFPLKEAEPRAFDANGKVSSSRRHVVLVVKNATSRPVEIPMLSLTQGKLGDPHGVPSVLRPMSAAAVGLANSGMSVKGAEAFLVLRTSTDEGAIDRYNEGVAADEEERKDEPPAATAEPAADPAASSFVPNFKSAVACVGVEITSLNSTGAGIQVVTEDPHRTPPSRATRPKLSSTPTEVTSIDPTETIKFTIEVDNTTKRVTVTVLETTPAIERAGGSTRMHLTIGVTGFMTTLDPRRPLEDQQVAAWEGPIARNASKLFTGTEGVVMHWEAELQQQFSETVGLNVEDSMGTAVGKKIEKEATKEAATKAATATILGASVKAAEALVGAFAVPMYAVWSADAIDNSYATLMNRSSSAGVDLAQALTSELRGNRPVTLVGFSFGCNVILSCLEELAKAGAYGIVQDAFLLGATTDSGRDRWRTARDVVAGRVVNVYNRSDWFLSFIHRSNTLGTGTASLAGLTRVAVAGVENIDASGLVDGHADYASKLDAILCLIPPLPTPESIDLEGAGAPGALVHVADREAAASRMLSAMSSSVPSMLSSSGGCWTVGLANRSPWELTTLDAQLFGCDLDFYPPSVIPPGECGVVGVVGRDGGGTAGGVMAFGTVMPKLEPSEPQEEGEDAAGDSSATLLLVLVFFYSPNKKTILGSSQALHLRIPQSDESSSTAAAVDAASLLQEPAAIKKVRDVLSAMVDGIPEVQSIVEDSADGEKQSTSSFKWRSSPLAGLTGGELVMRTEWSEDRQLFSHVSASGPDADNAPALLPFQASEVLSESSLLEATADEQRLLRSVRFRVGEVFPVTEMHEKLAGLDLQGDAPPGAESIVVVIVNSSANALTFVERGDGVLRLGRGGAAWARLCPPVIGAHEAAVLSIVAYPRQMPPSESTTAELETELAAMMYESDTSAVFVAVTEKPVPHDEESKNRYNCKCVRVPVDADFGSPTAIEDPRDQHSAAAIDTKEVGGQRVMVVMLD